jgi:hypothetical protein
MSVRESFDAVNEPAASRGPRAFTRWPGLLSLSLGLLLGPIVALTNQELIYSANMWACGHDEEATVEERTRFVALCGMALSFFSAAVIVAQWAAIFVFEPCMRA